VRGVGAGAGDRESEDAALHVVFKKVSVCPSFRSHESCVEVHGDMKVLVIEVGEFWCILSVSTYLSKVELVMLAEYFNKIFKRDFGIA